MPEIGAPLSMEDMDMIFEAVRDRQKNFPDEPAGLSFYIVISGIGDRFRPVQCTEQEWEGIKKDIPKGEGVPKCPNGHVLFEGPGVTVGWVPVD